MRDERGIPLHELAAVTGCRLRGDGGIRVTRVASLATADAEAVSFLADSRLRDELAGSSAAAVIVRPQDAGGLACAALITDNPHLVFARVATLLNPPAHRVPGAHAAACVDATACVSADAHVAAGAVIGARAVVGTGCVIEANAVIGEDSELGAACRIMAGVVLYPGCILGERVIVHGGAVIGADGFGYAHDEERWEKVPQLGRVRIGDDVEIGANSTVDRGAIEDTVIEEGVKIDNLVQIAHNVHIGAHSAMAGCSAVAGSTRIGRGVSIAGGAGISGHVEIADGTVVMGMARITHDIREPGAYASGTPMAPTRDWRRNAARFNQLDSMARRLRELERRLAALEPKERKDS